MSRPLKHLAGQRPSTTVVVADGNRMNCQLLVDAIQRHHQLQVVGSATHSKELISAVCEGKPDVALVSTSLQDGALAGLLVIPELRALHPGIHVIALLDEEERNLVVEVFRKGARGVFCRTGVFADLPKCIRSVEQGKIWANNNELEHIVDALMQAPAPNVNRTRTAQSLSKREEEIARLVATGLSNSEVSDKLGLSKHTVKNYLFRMFEKLGVSNRMEMVLFILSQNQTRNNKGVVGETNYRKSA
jgi:two-component system, NarL family, nitrate/nitrite response regulator NarL